MIFTVNGSTTIDVYYDSCLDGGGTWFGQEYIEILQRYQGKSFKNCYEWCSGPGYIGFSILAHGLCDRLFLSDRFPLATESISQTVDHLPDSLRNRVSWALSSRVADLPPTDLFDLVVGNPPHYLECPGDDNYQRIAVDPGWGTHLEFFQNIGQRLAPEGIILLQENQAGSLSGPFEFRDMIHQCGLKITGYFTSPKFYDTDGPTQIYYLEIKRAK